jgi:hypothetical protein
LPEQVASLERQEEQRAGAGLLPLLVVLVLVVPLGLLVSQEPWQALVRQICSLPLLKKGQTTYCQGSWL